MHLGRRVELDPPRLEQYDAWGKRVDRVIVNPAWNRLHDIAAEEGLIEIAYTRLHGPWRYPWCQLSEFRYRVTTL